MKCRIKISYDSFLHIKVIEWSHAPSHPVRTAMQSHHARNALTVVLKTPTLFFV